MDLPGADQVIFTDDVTSRTTPSARCSAEQKRIGFVSTIVAWNGNFKHLICFIHQAKIMRQISYALQRTARQSWTRSGALHHRFTASRPSSAPRIISPQPSTRFMTTNGAYTYESAKDATTERILKEREEAGSAVPVSIPPVHPKKRVRASRVTDLYNAIIYEDGSKETSEEWRRVLAVDKAGKPGSEEMNERIRVCLEDCRQVSHGEGGVGVLNDIEKQGYFPSARAVIMVIEACLPAEEFKMAENALTKLRNIPQESPAFSKRLECSAKSLIAFAYTSRGRYEDALRVMGLSNYKCVNWRRRESVARQMQELNLDRDTIAWGIILKSLTKLGMAHAAVEVVDVAMSEGVGMTDSLLHLTIEALRVMDRWRQAEWVFESAIEKGITPRERTIASMLLALVSMRGKRAVPKGRLEELLGMVQDPSPRFMSTALFVLMSAGLLERCEEIFKKLGECSEGGIPEETAFASLMGAYTNYIDGGWENERGKTESRKMYEEINGKVEEHWEAYLETYGQKRADGTRAKVTRGSLLTRYLRAKVRCFKITEAVNVLGDIARGKGRYTGFALQAVHMSSILGATELSCDVKEMKRVLEIMEEVGIKQDLRSLAFCVGTYLGDGNLDEALKLVREEGPRLLSDKFMKEPSYPEYHLRVLLRRLEMLESGFKEHGVRNVKDLQQFMEVLKGRIVIRV